MPSKPTGRKPGGLVPTRKLHTAEIAMGPWALSYRRVSSARQVREDPAGLERQEQIFQQFCAEYDLQPLSTAFVDEGRSAFRSTHLKKGAMGRLMEEARSGGIPERTVLILESMTRFSRDQHTNAVPLLIELLKLQLVIAIPSNGLLFDRERFDNDLSVRLLVDQAIASGNEFSQAQSYMAQYRWDERQRQWQEEGKRFGGKQAQPFWLDWHPELNAFSVNEKVKVLQQIFQLSIGGQGNSQIATALNESGITTPSSGKPFTAANISKWLTDRRALGEKAFPDGTVAEGYFPPVITRDEWERNAEAIEKRRKLTFKVGRGTAIRNLFQGGCRCLCGQSLYAQKSRGDTYRLRCVGRRNGTCTGPSQSWLYDEEALLLSFMAARWESFFNRPSDSKEKRALNKQLRELEAQVAEQRETASRAAANFTRLMEAASCSPDTIEQAAAAVAAAKDRLATALSNADACRLKLQQVEQRKTAAQFKAEIKRKVEQFLKVDRFDVENRREFNNWFLNLGVNVTITDPRYGGFRWETVEAFIYRDFKGDVVSDETISDMKAFGFPPAAIEQRKAEIRDRQEWERHQAEEST